MALLTVGLSSFPALGYYMAVSALTGQKKDIGRLKLLLPNLRPHSNFCLLFHYRLAGHKVGKLRVFVKNSNNALPGRKPGAPMNSGGWGKFSCITELILPKA